MIRQLVAASFALALVVGAARAEDSKIFKSSATGQVKFQSIDTINFGPNGTLLIGDGKGSQVIVVETGDTTRHEWKARDIEKIDEKLANKLGIAAKDLEIRHLAVNPDSGKAYLASFNKEAKKFAILTIDGEGKIGEFVMDSVKHAALSLPRGEKASVSRVTDLAWARDRILVAGACNEEFASKIFVIPAPLDPEAKALIYSANTYHVQHGKWETKAPIQTLMPYEEGGKTYLVGAFSCTPIVKYALDDLQPGAEVKGVSVAELGSGNQPLNMIPYEKDGKEYILVNTKRFHHDRKPFGPSPYWTARVDRSLLAETEKVNEKAERRIDKEFKPISDKLKLIEEYHGVVHMDKLDKDRALVWKEDFKGGFTLAAIPLP